MLFLTWYHCYGYRIADFKSPHDRFIQAVRWYMSAFHAGRKSSVAKKPYNPIIGETFICHYDVPNEPPEGVSIKLWYSVTLSHIWRLSSHWTI